MSEATIDASYIRMASHGSTGEPDVAIPLNPEHDNIHRRSPWRIVLDLSLTQMLAFICSIMAFVIIGLSIVTGYALFNDTNQHTRIDQLSNRVNEQQVTIDTLTTRVTNLEHR
jgi:hypothetical protein